MSNKGAWCGVSLNEGKKERKTEFEVVKN